MLDNAVRYAFGFRGKGGDAIEANRLQLYATLEGYYYGTIFEAETARMLGAITSEEADTYIKSLYTPFRSITDFYKLWTLQGIVGVKGDEGVTAELKVDNPALVKPVMSILEWSRFDQERKLVPLYAAMLGDALIVVQDSLVKRKVWIEFRHPGELVDADFDDRGNLTYAKLEHYRTERDPETLERRQYKYGRIYTKEWYITQRNGVDEGYDGRPARWRNPHGFVPVKLVKHDDDGSEFGLNSFHAAISAVNELNLRATNAGQLIGANADPQWAVFGMEPPDEEDDIERRGVWFFETGTDAKILVAELRIVEAYKHIETLRAALVDEYPELTLPQLRQASGELSGKAVRGMLMDLLKKAERNQARYTQGIIEAINMALTIGQSLGGTKLDLWRETHQADVGRWEIERNDRSIAIEWEDIIPLTEEEQLELEAAKTTIEGDITDQALRKEDQKIRAVETEARVKTLTAPKLPNENAA